MARAQEQMTHEQVVAKIGSLTKGIRFAMLTTMDQSGQLHARPMATQDLDFDGTLWFFTQRDSEKVDEFQRTPNVNVAYSDPGKQTYVSLAGTASLVDDADKKKELWQAPLKAWFPQGLEDPELTLIKVDVEGAEYWDSPNGKIVALVGLAKAVITGKPAQNIGENKTVEL